MGEPDIQRCTRHCATTGREFAPGEEFFSVLVEEGSELRRRDYSREAWTGPPDGVLAWWKSQMPHPNAKRANLAPNEVMLGLLRDLAEQPDRQDMRYVLALLLVRRRVLRAEEPERDPAGREVLVLYCPREDQTYRVAAVAPDEPRIQTIQDELARLLFADAV